MFDSLMERRKGKNTPEEIQKMLEHNSAGFRSVPGTSLKRSDGKTVYTPPQEKHTILNLMDNLEIFINDDRSF